MENNENSNKGSCLYKAFRLSLGLFGLFLICLSILCYFGYKRLSETNDLAVYLSQKLSKPNKYSFTINSFKNSLPLIIAENIVYEKISNVSSLSIKVGELTIYADYLNPKIGTHSFSLSKSSIFIRNPNFLMDCPKLELFGKYKQKQINIASSTFEVFGGKIYLSGNIDTREKPSPYNINAELAELKLQEVLAGTKNKGAFTGNIQGKLDLNSSGGKKSPLNGSANIYISEGTYYKPELIDRVNAALEKIGMKNRLKKYAEMVGSGSFILRGNFKIKGKNYETPNTLISLNSVTINFSGNISSKSGINGTFRVKVKNYSDFCVKVKSEGKNDIDYEISTSDKARIAAIIFRETGKNTEKNIKKEGRKFNKKFNNTANEVYQNSKEGLKESNIKTKRALEKYRKKIKSWWNNK